MKHFTLDELTRSDAARAHHLDNTPGEAADLTVGSRRHNRLVFEHIRLCLPFDQLIAEQPDAEGPAWVHVSYRAGRLRRQVVGGQ